LIPLLREGHAEKDLARMLGGMFEEEGASGSAYFGIIAYGPNAADPHHGSGSAVPREGQSIIMDIGSFYNAYCSDMTRTVFFGEPPEEHKTIYETVLQANCAAEAIIKPGVRFCDIDRAARSVIEEAGYGPNFTHRTGHNIGIDVHEYPDVSSVNEMPVQEGMIFSIEPGIYIPETVGVRIEDLVLVTDDGCEVLNSYDKDMKIV
jgi:Xaa-Pro dipeptidase